MSDLIDREAAISVIALTYGTTWEPHFAKLANAALRAIPTVQVAVKPLEWVDFPDRGAKAQAWNEANYMIQKWSDGRWELSASYPGYSTSIYGVNRFHLTLEAAKAAAQADYEAHIRSALTVTPAPDAAKLAALYDPEGHWGDFLKSAVAEAEKAMRKYPQPNYVISKVAEEAGEVVKAAIHCAEGRDTAENVRGEMRQLIAMLYRIWVEGDQVHGLPPVSAALAAMKEATK